jgi:hypothetical protein
MTITLELPPEIERGLSALAEAKGVTVADYAQQVLAREVAVDPKPAGAAEVQPNNLADLMAPYRGLLADEEIDLYFSRNRMPSRPIDLE